jgi:group I intron endonuclease
MSQDFNKGKIYKITNDYNDDIYVGSTCDTLIRRFINHKARFKKERSKNSSIYKLMNEIGFERFRIELIEEYPCQDKYQLRQREGHFIRELGTLNMRIECRTDEEYREYNKEHKGDAKNTREGESIEGFFQIFSSDLLNFSVDLFYF